MQKNVGTLVPLTALRSGRTDLSTETSGTFATGEVFLDWLARTGQNLWQVLPLAETHLEYGSRSVRVPSPYRGYGVGIDPRYVAGDEMGVVPTAAELAVFKEAQAAWIDDHALFCAIRDEQGTDDWREWPEALRDRDASALAQWASVHSDNIRTHEVDQWRAHRGFARMREKARSLGIRLAGDLSYYLPIQSPLTWAHRGAFDIGADGSVQRVSGVPDNANSHFGRQVWGHPLYDWSGSEDIMALWALRVRHAATLYDMVRIDHAKGFYTFGTMDVANPDNDGYRDGPGTPVFTRVIEEARAHHLFPFAEDSSASLPETLQHDLVDLHVPGIRILRFAYNERLHRFSRTHSDVRHYPATCVAYTSTHDTVPLVGYLKELGLLPRMLLARRTGAQFSFDAAVFAAALRGRLIDSPAAHVVIPLQDWLGIADRINVPGTELATGDPNWRWRMPMTIEDLPTALGLKRAA